MKSVNILHGLAPEKSGTQAVGDATRLKMFPDMKLLWSLSGKSQYAGFIPILSSFCRKHQLNLAVVRKRFTANLILDTINMLFTWRI
jgi:hypothetical protein